MTRSPTWKYPADSAELLILAWFSPQDVRGLLQRQKEAQPWITPQIELALQTRLEEVLGCFQADPIYGPVFLDLVRHRLNSIRLSKIAWAMTIEEMSAAHALYYSDSTDDQSQEPDTPLQETGIFWKAATRDIPLADRLHRLSWTWQGNTCRGAWELKTFFLLYLDLVQRPLHIPFFATELLCMSLQSLDWHVIAGNVLEVPPRSVCECAAWEQQEPLGAHVEYLGELCRAVADEILDLHRCLPEPQRAQSLFLANACRETTRTMRTMAMSNTRDTAPPGR